MKKTLMAGSALVASGLLLSTAAGTASAAEKIKLNLGGYMEQWFGYSDEDDTYTQANGRANGFDEKSDSEIYIKGATTLDNGLKVGVKWEIEGDGDNSGTSRFDEAMLYVSGSFGRINLGQEDTASELMGYGAPTVGPVGANKSDAGDWVRQPSNFSVLFTHNMDLGLSDTHGVTYFSPRIAGFQFGASYHPNVNEDSDGELSENSTAHNGMSTAVNYVGKFGGASVAGYVGVASKELADANTNTTADRHDSTGWGTGASVGFGNFTIGASYINENETETKDNTNVGVRYKAGMNAFSVAYQMANTTNYKSGDSTDDEGTLITVGYERTLGPGVKLGASVAKVDWDGNGTGASNDNDGIMVVGGVRLDF